MSVYPVQNLFSVDLKFSEEILKEGKIKGTSQHQYFCTGVQTCVAVTFISIEKEMYERRECVLQ